MFYYGPHFHLRGFYSSISGLPSFRTTFTAVSRVRIHSDDWGTCMHNYLAVSNGLECQAFGNFPEYFELVISFIYGHIWFRLLNKIRLFKRLNSICSSKRLNLLRLFKRLNSILLFKLLNSIHLSKHLNSIRLSKLLYSIRLFKLLNSNHIFLSNKKSDE